MYISIITYAVLLFLLFYNAKIAWKQDSYINDFSTVESTKGLRGFLVICIILHHISQEEAFRQTHILGIFPEQGYIFVALFFFWSGFGLIKSLRHKNDYLNTFLKKRVLPLVVIFYVTTLFYALFNIITGVQMTLSKWLLSFSGLILMNGQSWYVVVLIILYVSFWVIFKTVKKEEIAILLILFIVLAMGAIFIYIGHFGWFLGPDLWWLDGKNWKNLPWWKNYYVFWFSGEWWVNSSIAFVIGLLFAKYENKIVDFLKKKYFVKFLVLTFMLIIFWLICNYCLGHFSYWSEYSGKSAKLILVDRLISYLSTLPKVCLFVIWVYMLLMKVSPKNEILTFMSKISLETYLVQLIPLTLFKTFILKNGQAIVQENFINLFRYEVLVLIFSIALGFGFSKLMKVINKRLK